MNEVSGICGTVTKEPALIVTGVPGGKGEGVELKEYLKK